jgi:Flp pilus assembly protein TadG
VTLKNERSGFFASSVKGLREITGRIRRALLRSPRFAFFRDDRGSEVVEYALVLSVFALLSLVSMQAIAETANARVQTDQNSYAGAFVNGY